MATPCEVQNLTESQSCKRSCLPKGTGLSLCCNLDPRQLHDFIFRVMALVEGTRSHIKAATSREQGTVGCHRVRTVAAHGTPVLSGCSGMGISSSPSWTNGSGCSDISERQLP